MFFSSSPIFPFRTMKQVVLTDYFVEKYFKLFCFIYQALALYPKWKMILTEGDQLSIEERAKAGDDLLTEQWRRVEAGGGDGDINYPFSKTFRQEFFLKNFFRQIVGKSRAVAAEAAVGAGILPVRVQVSYRRMEYTFYFMLTVKYHKNIFAGCD